MDITYEKCLPFLNKCGIVFDNYNHLNNMLIPRDILVSEKKYDEIKEDIKELKKFLAVLL